MILTKVKMFAVMRSDPNDGKFYPVAYFSNIDKANGRCSEFGDHVSEVDLWRIQDGSSIAGFCEVKMTPVDVDIPSRDSVLAKLTDKEKIALGFKP